MVQKVLLYKQPRQTTPIFRHHARTFIGGSEKAISNAAYGRRDKKINMPQFMCNATTCTQRLVCSDLTRIKHRSPISSLSVKAVQRQPTQKTKPAFSSKQLRIILIYFMRRHIFWRKQITCQLYDWVLRASSLICFIKTRIRSKLTTFFRIFINKHRSFTRLKRLKHKNNKWNAMKHLFSSQRRHV